MEKFLYGHRHFFSKGIKKLFQNYYLQNWSNINFQCVFFSFNICISTLLQTSTREEGPEMHRTMKKWTSGSYLEDLGLLTPLPGVWLRAKSLCKVSWGNGFTPNHTGAPRHRRPPCLTKSVSSRATAASEFPLSWLQHFFLPFSHATLESIPVCLPKNRAEGWYEMHQKHFACM